MITALKSTAFAAIAALGSACGAQAATVASVDVSFFEFGGIIHEIEQDGYYALDFSGLGLFPGFPAYLGFAAYVFAEVEGGLDDLPEALAGGTGISAFDGTSVGLGFLEAGADFAAGILSLGNATMSLVRIDDTPAPIPLPATLPLLAVAAGAAGLAARRRKDA